MLPFLHLFRLAANACGTKTGVLPSLYDHIPCTPDKQGVLVPDIKSLDQIFLIVSNVVRILIAVSGGLAVIMIIVGAIYYIVSAGDAGRIKRAKDILINSIVGLVIILVAYTVVTWIARGF